MVQIFLVSASEKEISSSNFVDRLLQARLPDLDIWEEGVEDQCAELREGLACAAKSTISPAADTRSPRSATACAQGLQHPDFDSLTCLHEL